MSNPPPLEDNPGLKSLLRKSTELSMTTLMWALWFYFFMPLLSLPLWVVGLPHIYRTLFREETLQQLLNLLAHAGWAVLIIFGVLRGWGLYNYYFFGRHDRRKKHPEVSLAELCRHFGVTPDEVQKLQQQKEIVWPTLYDDMRTRENN